MDENTSFDDILSDEPAVEAAQAEPAPQPQETPATPSDGPQRDEQGRFAAKTGVEEAVPPTDKLPQEDYKAIREERAKRQTLEAELADLKNQFQSFQQPKEPPAPPPNIWEDEEGTFAHHRQQAVSEAVQTAVSQATMRMSEMMARQAEPEFDALKAEFIALAEKNPALAEQALADPHPWNKAITIARNHKAMTDLGAVDVAQLEAKLRAKIMEEMGAIPPTRPMIPPSITGERSVASRSGPEWSGPTALRDLLA